MDQVTLVGPEDLESLSFHLLFSRQNVPFVRHTYYIVPEDAVSQEKLLSLQKTMEPDILGRVSFIPETELLPAAVSPNKWLYQQLLKLSLFKLKSIYPLSEPFLITDVDTLALRPVAEADLKYAGKYLYWTGLYQQEPEVFADHFGSVRRYSQLLGMERARLSWLIGFSWTSFRLLGIEDPPCLSAVNACAVWYSVILEGIAAFLEKKYGRPFYEAILEAFRTFINEHPEHFYTFGGYRKVVFSLSPLEGLQKCPQGPEWLYQNLRVGFSEWQLYTYFLTLMRQQPYSLHLQQAPHNDFIAELNTEIASITALERVFSEGEAGRRNKIRFINFYPKINNEVKEFLNRVAGRSENSFRR